MIPNDRLPLLITGVTGVAGYNALSHFRARYPGRVIATRGILSKLDGDDVVGLAIEDQDGLSRLFREHGIRSVLNATGNLYQRSQPTCKLLLKRLSASYPGDEIMESLSDVTVEHVLPRNLPPDSAWRLEIPNAEERDACSRLLGNLVLVTKQQNKDARNHPFAVKKRILFPDGQTSPHAITNQIMRAQNWRAGEIRAREAVLGQRLREIWSLTGKVAVKRARPAASN